jgi:hypothetical protein
MNASVKTGAFFLLPKAQNYFFGLPFGRAFHCKFAKSAKLSITIAKADQAP